MEAVLSQLRENLQVIYRKSVDADAAIAQLQTQGKGKFGQIFDAESGFRVTSKQFKPYVEELASDIEALGTTDEASFETQLAAIVKKMEVFFRTLNHFKDSVKD